MLDAHRAGQQGVARLEVGDDALDDLRALVLRELRTRLEALDPEPEPDRPLRDAPRLRLVVREMPAALAAVLEPVGELLERPVVLLVGEDLGRAVEVRGHEVPRRHRGVRVVPARRDVAVRALDDHEHLVAAELVDLLMVMARWGDTWLAGTAGPPVLYRHHSCGEIARVDLRCEGCGEPMHAGDVDVLPGPGAAER